LFSGEAPQTSLQGGGVEVYEQWGGKLGELQVGQNLSLVHGKETLYSLDLDQQEVSEHDIEAVAAIQADALVDNRKGALAFELKAAQGQLVGQALFIRRFEQAGAEMAVHFDTRADDLLGTIIKSSCLPVFL
jgi:hypothetical protein